MGSDSSAETIPENCIKSIITLSIAFRVFWGKLKLTQSYSSVQKRTAVIKKHFPMGLSRDKITVCVYKGYIGKGRKEPGPLRAERK